MQRDKFNNGNWTRARFNAFIKSALRSASMKWPVKYHVLSAACVGTKINEASGRMAKHYACNICCKHFVAKDIEVDHIIPIMSEVVLWDDVIDRMFCEANNLQVLCKPCHKVKTLSEK